MGTKPIRASEKAYEKIQDVKYEKRYKYDWQALDDLLNLTGGVEAA